MMSGVPVAVRGDSGSSGGLGLGFGNWFGWGDCHGHRHRSNLGFRRRWYGDWCKRQGRLDHGRRND